MFFSASGFMSLESALISVSPLPIVAAASSRSCWLPPQFWVCILARVSSWPMLSCSSQLILRRVSSRISIWVSAISFSNCFFDCSCSKSKVFLRFIKTENSTTTTTRSSSNMVIATKTINKVPLS